MEDIEIIEPGVEHRLAEANKTQKRRLAKAIVEHRKRLGLSQRKLANEIGVSVQLIGHIEKCRNLPSISVYLALCRKFGLPKPPMFDKPLD